MRLCLAVLLAAGVAGCRDDAGPPGKDDSRSPAATAPAAPVPGKSASPHGGLLLPIPNGRGAVEWVVDDTNHRLRLYFLTPDQQPLADVGEAFLVLETPAGPQVIELADCDDPAFAHACVQATGDDWPKDQPGTLVRFLLGNEGFRVRLPAPESDR